MISFEELKDNFLKKIVLIFYVVSKYKTNTSQHKMRLKKIDLLSQIFFYGLQLAVLRERRTKQPQSLNK